MPHILKTPGRTPASLSIQMLIALACLAIVIAGASMRLAGSDWDRGANLHPDERHMMFMVTSSLEDIGKLEPGTLSASEMWFDTGRSPLDPRREQQFYVYGELPHLAVVLAALAFGKTGWPEILVMARNIGAVLDAYTVLAVFLLAAIGTRNAAAGLFAAALYAFAPLAIQNANFFTVDVWLTAASAWCLVAATMIVRARGAAVPGWIVLAGILAGLAAACKLPGMALAGVMVLAVLIRHLRHGSMLRMAAAGHQLLGLATAFLAFRLACPFNFAGPGFLDIAPAGAVIDGYREAGRIVQAANFPPNWQWFAGYSRGDAVLDLFLWGLGPAIALAVAIGLVLLPLRAARQWQSAVLPGAFGLVLAAYWLSGNVLALRYVLPALVVLCAIGGFGLVSLRSPAGRVLALAITAMAGVWSLGMVGLHTGVNSRITASAWLWAETRPGTVVAGESPWDDALPVPLRQPGTANLRWPGQDDHFRFLTLNLEYEDNAQKAHDIAARLGEADLLVISSERMRRPMLALRARFPMMAVYYAMLASGELCFERVFERRPGYTVLGHRFDDSGAQEIWSVYDHPTVEIYRRQACYDPARLERRLLQALPSG